MIIPFKGHFKNGIFHPERISVPGSAEGLYKELDEHSCDPCIAVLLIRLIFSEALDEVTIFADFHVPAKREWFMDFKDQEEDQEYHEYQERLSTVSGSVSYGLDGTPIQINIPNKTSNDNAETVELRLEKTPEDGYSDNQSPQEEVVPRPVNSTAQPGNQPPFDLNISSIHHTSNQSFQETNEQTAASSHSTIFKKTLIRDFITEDKSEWQKMTEFPLTFRADLIESKVQIADKKGQRLSYIQRKRIYIKEKKKQTDNSREALQHKKRKEKEKQKHARSEPRQGSLVLQPNMSYFLTDIPDDRFKMIYNEKYIKEGMDTLYQYHRRTKHFDLITHDKHQYMESTIIPELQSTYRFLEIIQRPADSNENEYTSTGFYKLHKLYKLFNNNYRLGIVLLSL